MSQENQDLLQAIRGIIREETVKIVRKETLAVIREETKHFATKSDVAQLRADTQQWITEAVQHMADVIDQANEPIRAIIARHDREIKRLQKHTGLS